MLKAANVLMPSNSETTRSGKMPSPSPSLPPHSLAFLTRRHPAGPLSHLVTINTVSGTSYEYMYGSLGQHVFRSLRLPSLLTSVATQILPSQSWSILWDFLSLAYSSHPSLSHVPLASAAALPGVSNVPDRPRTLAPLAQSRNITPPCCTKPTIVTGRAPSYRALLIVPPPPV